MTESTKRRILIVDDDEATRMMTAEVLRSAGYTTTAAENGEAALAAMSTDHFDLVLMDIDMPVMTGTEAIARIREDEANGKPRTAVIAYSANQPEDRATFRKQHGFDAFVSKESGLLALRKAVDAFFAVRALK